jgi:hypothetical protein
MLLKSIIRKPTRESNHVTVAPHFRDNGSGGDERLSFVAADNRLLKRKGAGSEQPSVEKHATSVRIDTEFAESATERDLNGFGQSNTINVSLSDERRAQTALSTRNSSKEPV